MTTTRDSIDEYSAQLDHARALVAEGLDGLADATGEGDLRTTIQYATMLLSNGSAVAVTQTGGWFAELVAECGRVPTVLELDARLSGPWWTTLGCAYRFQGLKGLREWGVPEHLLDRVAFELLGDAFSA